MTKRKNTGANVKMIKCRFCKKLITERRVGYKQNWMKRKFCDRRCFNRYRRKHSKVREAVISVKPVTFLESLLRKEKAISKIFTKKV